MFSYYNIYGDGGLRQQFKSVARSGFNAGDTVDVRFFKLLFYFYNDEEGDTTQWNFYNGGPSGLLAPTWLDNPTGDYYKYNSAWAYLKNNFEEERAKMLEEFVNLLSQISSQSPWYFTKITGVDEAMTRDDWKVGDERKKISITCMADAVDHRIESLLSLYRSIVWSHSHKCEVLPANLRKFDMGLFVFSGLVNSLHGPTVFDPRHMNDYDVERTRDWLEIAQDYKDHVKSATYKYIEFHNCEFDIDSIKSGYTELNNEDGVKQEFTIDIYFDGCCENEYNQFIMREFGDFFVWDAWVSGRNSEGDTTGNIPYYLNPNDNTDMTDYDITGYDYWDTFAEYEELKNRLSVFTNPPIIKRKEEKPNVRNIYENGINQLKNTLQESANQMREQLGNLQNRIIGNVGSLEEYKQKTLKNMNSSFLKAEKAAFDTANDVLRGVTTNTINTVGAIGNFALNNLEKQEAEVFKGVNGIIQKVGGAAIKTTRDLGNMAYNNVVGSEEKLSRDVNGVIQKTGDVVNKRIRNLGNMAYNAISDTEKKISNNLIGKNRLQSKK